MKKALIDPNGILVQVEDTEFAVADPFYWIDVADDVTPTTHIWNGTAVVIAPPPPPPPVPTVVTMRQARLALLGSGLLATVNTAVAAMTGEAGDAARVTWEFAATVDRNSPLVTSLSAALSLDSTALDALFTTAATL